MHLISLVSEAQSTLQRKLTGSEETMQRLLAACFDPIFAVKRAATVCIACSCGAYPLTWRCSVQGRRSVQVGSTLPRVWNEASRPRHVNTLSAAYCSLRGGEAVGEHQKMWLHCAFLSPSFKRKPKRGLKLHFEHSHHVHVTTGIALWWNCVCVCVGGFVTTMFVCCMFDTFSTYM